MEEITKNKTGFKAWMNKHPVLTVVITGILFIVIVSIISGASSSNTNNIPPQSVQTNQPQTTQTQSQKQQAQKPLDYFGDGTFIVGKDIQAGTYRNGGSAGCYYARLSGFGGTTDDIISNANTDAVAIVTILSTDAGFESKRCGTWNKISGIQSNTQKPTQSSVQQQTTQASPLQLTTQPAPVPKSWHTVAVFSGPGSKNTAPFSITGSQWRLDWSITPKLTSADCAKYNCGMNVQIHKDDGSFVDQFNQYVQEVSSGTSYEYNETGNFYLSIVEGNTNSWTITIEDYY